MTIKPKLVVFAKAPLPGQAKTRLSPPFTSEEAAALAEAFLIDTLDMIEIADLNVWKIIYFTPEYEANYFSDMISDGWQIKPQRGKSFKMRLINALREESENGDQPVVVIGADSPTLPPHYLVEAFKLLKKVDLVIGPALDGGFYLIGIKKFRHGLLNPVILSKADSCSKLVSNAARIGLTYKTLPTWYDIDHFDDLDQINDPKTVNGGFTAFRTRTMLTGLGLQQHTKNEE